MIGLFIGALLGIAVLVGIIVLAGQPGPPESCPADTICPPPPPPSTPRPTLAAGQTTPPVQTLPPGVTPAPTPEGQTPGPDTTPLPTPISNAPPAVSGEVWRSPTLGYSFEYDSKVWRVIDSRDAFVHLAINFRPDLELGPVELQIIGFPGDTTVDSALQNVLGQVDTFVIGRAQNTRTYDALLGPGIGYVRGEGDVYSGTFRNGDGSPGAPAGITIMGATNGHATVVLLVLTTNPDKIFSGMSVQHLGRADADQIVKTFLWERAQ